MADFIPAQTRQQFAQFAKAYIPSAAHQTASADTGLWLALTPIGEVEWEARPYERYWRSPAISRPLRFGIQWVVMLSVAGLMIFSVWGALIGSVSYGVDCRVSLASELRPIRESLVAANAPASVVRSIEKATSPNIWLYDALALIMNARDWLELQPSSPTLDALHEQWSITIAHLSPYRYCRR